MTSGASELARSGAVAEQRGPLRRFHTHAADLDEASLQAVYRHCEALMRLRGCTAMGLAVKTKASLVGVVREVYGGQVVRLLDRENRRELRGTVIQLLTEKIQVRRLSGPVLAAFVAPDSLPRIITAQGVTDIVFVPQLVADLDAYLEAYPDSLKCYPMSSFALDVPGS